MASPCLTNADCLPLLYLSTNTSVRNWCIEAVNCDPHYLQCVTWARCATVWSQNGCLADQQTCVDHPREFPLSTNGVTTVTVSSWATMQTAAVLIPLIILVIAVFFLFLAVLAATVSLCRCPARRRRGQEEDDTHVPLVNLDAAISTFLESEQDEEKERQNQAHAISMETLYNQDATGF